MLWDNSEKMLDNNFQIHIFEFNNSVNNTNYYSVILDSNETTGFFQDYITLNLSTNKAIIFKLEVKVNNETILIANNIKILEGLSSSGIQDSHSPFLLSLSPWEWSNKEWNIVGAIVLSSILAMFIGYRVAKRYRTLHGVREVK